MTDILDEVLNDQNEEKRLKYFKKLLPLIIIGTIIVVVIMLINNWNENKKILNNQKMGDILIKSIKIVDVNKELAFGSLENLINTSNNHIADLAALEQAGINISNNNLSSAKQLLEKIIQNTKYHDITTAYARISWLAIAMDENNLSEDDVKKMTEYFAFFKNEDQIFFGTANILKALWYSKNLQINEARQTLSIILSANNTPQLIKDQARALMANLDRQ